MGISFKQNIYKLFNIQYSVVIFIVFGLTIQLVNAQYFPSKIYPTNYFGNPLGIPMQLSGNFGELRKEHFHMGLDLRTNQKENLPVYASASGYISRIKIERFGYGRAIYIKHNNGYTTVYAHLNNFYDTLNKLVVEKQYKEQQWEQDIAFAPNQFVVTKGQFIAFSGNTGGSQGPHLHFEIRDENDINQNPLLFNFNIPDTKPPAFERLYFYDRNITTFESSPNEINLLKNKLGTRVKDSVVLVNSNKISFGISAQDITNTSPFKFGIFQAEVWVDSALAFAFKLNDFAYENSRYINACTDYVENYKTGKNIQHLSKLPGNALNIFASNTSNGVIELNDTLPKLVEIIIKDAVGNSSNLSFLLQKKDTVVQQITIIPDTLLLPNTANKYSKNNLQLEFNNAAFYDTLPLQIQYATHPIKAMVLSNQYTINPQLPVHNNYEIALKLLQPIAENLQAKTLMVLKNKNSTYTQIPIWKNDTAVASFNKFGFVELLMDTVPPTIKPIAWHNNFTFNNQTQIVVEVKDAVSEIEHYSAELDGSWLMFRRKNDLFIYDFDERCALGNHSLKIKATDAVGNIIEETFVFTKMPPKINKYKKKVLHKKKKATTLKKKK